MKIEFDISAKSHVDALAQVDAPGFSLNPNMIPNDLRDEMQVVREAVRKLISLIPMNGHDVAIAVEVEVDGTGASNGTIQWSVQQEVVEVPDDEKARLEAEAKALAEAEELAKLEAEEKAKAEAVEKAGNESGTEDAGDTETNPASAANSLKSGDV